MATVEGSHIGTSGGSSVGALLYYGTIASSATEYTVPIKAGGKLTKNNWTSASIVYKMGGSPNTSGTAYWTKTDGSTHSSGSSWYTLSEQKVHFKRTHSDYTATIYASITTNEHTSTAKKTFTVSKRASYTVSYNANGGSGAPSAQTKWYGETLTLSSTVPTRAKYEFKGWATSAAGDVAVQPSGTYTGNAAITYYAVWELVGDVKTESYFAIRCDSNGNADDEGTYGKFTCTYTLLGQALNEGSVTARYRESSGSTWTDIDITDITHGEHIKAEGVTSLSVNVSYLISGISQDKSYVIEMTVTDSYGNTAIAYDYISQAFFTMDFLAGGKGIGIGTTASCDETAHPNGLLTCAMDADFTGKVNANDADFNGTININGIPIKGCHKIRLSKTGEDGTYTEDSIGYYMTSTHKIYLEEKVSEQLSGIILVWSAYSGGVVQEAGFQFTVIPKTILSDNPSGGGIVAMMANQALFASVGAKYIYIRDNYIFGNDNNNKTGTGTSAIKYSNNAFVLRWVYGF